MHLPHAEQRQGTILGVFALLLLIGLGLIVSVHAPSRDNDDSIHNAAAVSW